PVGVVPEASPARLYANTVKTTESAITPTSRVTFCKFVGLNSIDAPFKHSPPPLFKSRIGAGERGVTEYG
ncbi:MAG: hypothetical protein NT023_21070, partial [Armatimonadetes bacterium]|nr:hypothetical protein [Armatimonadota bacterium]